MTTPSEGAAPSIRIEPTWTGEVTIIRGSDVTDVLWLQLRARWGSAGPDPRTRIEVAREVFLRDLDTLRTWPGDIDWEPSVRAVALAAIDDENALDSVLSGDAPDVTPDVAMPAAFVRHPSLTDFQTRNVSKLLALAHGANFSVPGAGKTATTMAIFAALREKGFVDRLCVVAPNSAFESWQDEAVDCFNVAPSVRIFAGGRVDPEAEVVLMGYARLNADLNEVLRWARSKKTMVVLDEAHRMKAGWRGQWGRSCLILARAAARRDILSGTPAPNSPADLETLFEFLWPSSAAKVGRLLATSVGRQTLSSLFVRTTKEDLELPPARIVPDPVDLDDFHREVYTALVQDYQGLLRVSQADRANFARMGRITMHLIAAATDPMMLVSGYDKYDPEPYRFPPLDFPEGSRLRDLMASYNDYGRMPQKLLKAAALVKANADEGLKTLIWSNFVRTVTVMAKHLARLKPAVIHGGIPFDGDGMTRVGELDRFRNRADCMVLIATVQSIGEGVSLHDDCHRAIYLDRTYNAGHYLQSLDRIHRLGLPPGTDTTMTVLQARGTIDEAIEARLDTKIQGLYGLMSDAGIPTLGLPDEDNPGASIDMDEDVESLLDHLRGSGA